MAEKTRRRMSRRMRIIIGSTAVVLVIVGFVFYLFWVPSQTVPQEQERPPVAEQTLKKTTLQEMREWFGPWELASPGSTGQPALVILRPDGGIDVSSWTVPVNDTWTRSAPIEIDNATGNDDNQTLRLRTLNGREYVVGFNQPFVFEGRPERVYAYRLVGVEYVPVTITTEQARQLGQPKK